MGIDNANVRFVVHWTPPRGFEGSLQEPGRVGRDGCAATHLMFYRKERDPILDSLRKNSDQAQSRLGRFTRTSDSTNKKEFLLEIQKARMESFRKVIHCCKTTDVVRVVRDNWIILLRSLDRH